MLRILKTLSISSALRSQHPTKNTRPRVGPCRRRKRMWCPWRSPGQGLSQLVFPRHPPRKAPTCLLPWPLSRHTSRPPPEVRSCFEISFLLSFFSVLHSFFVWLLDLFYIFILYLFICHFRVWCWITDSNFTIWLRIWPIRWQCTDPYCSV